MHKAFKVLFVILTLLGISFFFQNCKVKKNEQGQYQSIQDFPKVFDKITLSTGFSDNDAELSSYLEIDLEANKIESSSRRLDNTGGLCDNQMDISDELKAEINEKYHKSKLCIVFVEPAADTVCTMDMKANEYLKIYSGDKKQLSATLLGKTCGHSGAMDQLCEGGQDFLQLLVKINKSLIDSCR